MHAHCRGSSFIHQRLTTAISLLLAMPPQVLREADNKDKRSAQLQARGLEWVVQSEQECELIERMDSDALQSSQLSGSN